MSDSRLTKEQRQIRDAAQRLLTGTPQRSNGKLTVAGLAAEAAVPRHRLYEHHAHLVAEFQTTATGGPTPPNVQAIQQQLADALSREQQLLDENTALGSRIRTLTAVIVELTQERSDTIVPIRRYRRSRVNTN